jgi:hypothetical protein
MKTTIWYGFSQSKNRVIFFDSNVGQNSSSYGELLGYGSFTINGDTIGLQIEPVSQQKESARV